MDKKEIKQIEIDLLLEALLKRYGYDFRNYSRASLTRRIGSFLRKVNGESPSALLPEILYNKPLFESLVYTISVPVTDMFRDPFVYRIIRERAIEYLKTYPFIRIWHAGCATGEEVYSMAILLMEEGILERCQIYATDINDEALEKATLGIYPAERVKTYTNNYQKAGGQESFSSYYHSKYDSVILRSDLKKRIVFVNHNLTLDTSFGEMHLIMCRNVLIYFNQALQDRVLKVFYDSLAYKGLLCLGTKESIRFSKEAEKYAPFSKSAKIFSRL